MSAVLQLDPLDLGDVQKKRAHGALLRYVLRRRDEEHRARDPVQIVDDAPRLDISDDVELGRAHPGRKVRWVSSHRSRGKE